MFILISCLAGCISVEDIDALALKSLFYNNNADVIYKNEQTGEFVHLKAESFTCHKTGTYDKSAGTHSIRRIHTEICGQIIRQDENRSHLLDHSISSATTNLQNKWIVYFDKSTFSFPYYPTTDDTTFIRLDSLEMHSQMYHNVYVITSQKISSSNRLIDSLYIHPPTGILKIITSSNQTWVLQ